MRALQPVALAFVLAVAGGYESAAAQGGLETLGGLGDFIRSFRADIAYVGSVQVTLRPIPAVKQPVRLHGFSVTSPGGTGWYAAAGERANEERYAVQTAWFVRDPERLSEWSRRKRLESRPLSLIAQLRLLGRIDRSELAAAVMRAKTAEWSGEGIRDLTLNVVLDVSGDYPCANYDGHAVDERAPKGFLPSAFAVTFSGRVCPHPAAAWLAVDIGSIRRTADSESVVAADAVEAGFVASLRMETFNGPIVEDVLLLGPGEGAAGQRSWITGTAISPGSLWISQQFDRVNGSAGSSASPGRMLSRIDVTSNRILARVPVDGALAGVAAGSVWMASRDRGWRLDPASNEIAQEFSLACPSGTTLSGLLRAGEYGAWLACAVPEKKQGMWPRLFAMRRLDTTTGAPLWDLRMPGGGKMQANSDHIWVADGEPKPKACRVHEVDPETQRLLRTLVLGKFACTGVTLDGKAAWVLRNGRRGTEVVKIEMATGAIIAVTALGSARDAYNLAVGEDTVWVPTRPPVESPQGGLDLGSRGGLVTIDRATGRIRHAAVPTGSASYLLGADRRAVWLYNPNGTIVRIVDR